MYLFLKMNHKIFEGCNEKKVLKVKDFFGIEIVLDLVGTAASVTIVKG